MKKDWPVCPEHGTAECEHTKPECRCREKGQPVTSLGVMHVVGCPWVADLLATGGCQGDTDVDLAEQERQWNLAHGLTASCTFCKGAMKDDGREYCSWACYCKDKRKNEEAASD